MSLAGDSLRADLALAQRENRDPGRPDPGGCATPDDGSALGVAVSRGRRAAQSRHRCYRVDRVHPDTGGSIRTADNKKTSARPTCLTVVARFNPSAGRGTATSPACHGNFTLRQSHANYTHGRDEEAPMKRELRAVVMCGALFTAALGGQRAAHADAQCPLTAATSALKHVVFLEFDNLHLERDAPNVPSDLERMPALFHFLTDHGVLSANDHTVQISHT